MLEAFKEYLNRWLQLGTVEPILWGAAIGFAIGSVVSVYFKLEVNYALFSLQLSSTCFILAVAVRTFDLMKNSTKETVDSILTLSKTESEKFTETVTVLNKVASSLEILANDVTSKSKTKPLLRVRFGPDPTEKIKLNSGNENEIEVLCENRGTMDATSATWKVFFPPDIEVIEHLSAESIKQKASNRFPHHTCVIYRGDLESRSSLAFVVKIRTEKNNIGTRIIPFSVSAKETPAESGSIEIEFIG